MPTICPTVTAAEPHEYRAQLERLLPFAGRIHLDFADGSMTQNRLINLIQAYLPEGITVDLHLMYRRPIDHIETIVSLNPSMVIIQAEAEGDLTGMIGHLKKFGIKTGLCLLASSEAQQAAELIKEADHVLLFGGNLGHFGGHADLSVLKKIPIIKELNPEAEIGWDGGANIENVQQLATSGVDVINVGSAIQGAKEPGDVYKQLSSLASH